MNKSKNTSFDSIADAIDDIAAGKMVIVTDDESRENEGDLVMAAEKVTHEAINTMIKHGRGLICVPTVGHQLQRLGINQMVADNRESHKTDFSVSVDAAEGITTGISAYDRAATIKILANPEGRPDMLVQPGHVFPLRAKPGGVLQRAGHTEAAVDLASLAGLHPSGVICEILNEDGSMARLPELIEFKKKFGMKLISISDLIHYRHQREKLIEHVTTLPFESEFGLFDLHIFIGLTDHRRHYALSMGKLGPEPTLVRVHSENLLGDVFRSSQFASFQPLMNSLKRIAKEKHGVLLYIEQPGGGILIKNAGDEFIKTNLMRANMDFRDYGVGAQILSELGLQKIKLLSTATRKVIALDGYGLEIVEQVALD
jgi:3,4-dihydroxy 2-butanone 4-phosphate synthase / GTP cyclohydrolase II